MSPDNVQNLKGKIALLTEELSELETKRDGAVEKRRVREVVTAFATISDVQRRLDAARRLLARAEGDEYSFVTR